MISWIQNSFHKHFRWVFASVLFVMAIPLIMTFTPSSGVGRGGQKILERPFFGYNLGNEAQTRAIFKDGSLSAQLKGANQVNDQQLQLYSLSRIAGLALSDELKIPQPTGEVVSKYVASLPVFRDEQGNFDQKRYSLFADTIKNNPQLTTAEANRVFRDDARLDQLSKLLGGPGYVLPGDVQSQLIRADSSWTIGVATLDYATFDPGVNPSEDALKKFFDENSFRYEVQPRAKLTLVEFKHSEFTVPGNPTEAELRAFYDANASRFPVPPEAAKPADAKPALTPTTPADNFAKVRSQVEAAIRTAAAQRLANKAANEFTVALYERKAAANTADLAQFLVAQHRTAIALPPLSADAPPADRAWLASYGDQITRLDKTHFFSDPLATPDSVAVLLWNETLPAYKPMFAEVRDKVAADFKDNEKRKAFVERGKVLRSQLQAAVKAGTAFEKAAVDAKLEVKAYPSFNLRQPPQDLPYPAYSALQNLDTGQVAEMISSGDKGYLVCAIDRKQPDLTAANPRVAEMRAQLMQFTATSNETSYLSELVERELKKSAPISGTP